MVGEYRPGHVVALAMDSVSAETFELRDEAARKFNVYGSPHASSYNNNKMHIPRIRTASFGMDEFYA